MKSLLVFLTALACTASLALGGPNAGGVILVHDPNLPYTGQGTYCGHGSPPASCEAAATQIDGNDNTYMIWKIYAAFPPCTAPRLKAVSWGIHYDPWVILIDHGPCIGDLQSGGFEQAGPGWPGSDTGDAVLFQFTQTTTLVEYYWFAGYAYYGQPGIFALRSNPDPAYGGTFADDSTPLPLLDPIAGYGALGFNQPGWVTCPTAAAEGACCVGGSCSLTCENECQGDFQGQNTVCDPNPCVITYGACCIYGGCIIVTQEQCVGGGGIYLGDGTDCEHYGEECFQPPFGACCIGSDCIIEISGICAEMGGTFQGVGTSCNPNPCPVTPVEQSSWGRIKLQYR